MMKFFFFRIGDGHCTYIEFPNGERGFVDLNRKGPNEGEDPIQIIWNAGIRRIDHLFITHPHRDHITGFKVLFESFQVVSLYYSGVYFRPDPVYDDWLSYEEKKRNHPSRYQVGVGYYTPVAQVRIDYLLPPANLLTGTNDDVNNNSLLLKFTYGATRVLICGDTQEDAWRRVSDYDISTIDLLLAAHHGNDSGYYQPKVRVMNPKYVVISAGPGTPHDADQKYRRYARAGVYTTRISRVVAVCDDRGNVTIT
jgi:beta-lactamase superfamily II metal-dependent hydrolase